VEVARLEPRCAGSGGEGGHPRPAREPAGADAVEQSSMNILDAEWPGGHEFAPQRRTDTTDRRAPIIRARKPGKDEAASGQVPSGDEEGDTGREPQDDDDPPESVHRNTVGDA